MRDRQIRRRRLTLLACVVASLVLITMYFGESDSGGGLHGAQRGVVDILSPLQEGANRALKPARDFVGWFGDTLDAKGERDELKEQRDRLRQQVGELQAKAGQYEQLARAVKLDSNFVSSYAPLTARVIGRSTNAWFSTLMVNKGSGDGLRIGQPVVGDGALVGKVISVGGSTAQVKLITDEGFAASAETDKGVAGLVEPSVGSRTSLEFELASSGDDELPEPGDDVNTAGTRSDAEETPSLFPAGIPIGTVSSLDTGSGPLDTEIKIEPAADLSKLDFVQILLQPHARGETQASTTP